MLRLYGFSELLPGGPAATSSPSALGRKYPITAYYVNLTYKGIDRSRKDYTQACSAANRT